MVTVQPCSQAYPALFFFVLQFAFSIIHRGGREVKNGEGLGTPITCMMPGGHEVDVGVAGVVPNYEFVCNKP